MKTFSFFGSISFVILHALPLFSQENKSSFRDFNSFKPKSSSLEANPEHYLTGLLLDRERVESFDSYLIQVLFHGESPDSHSVSIDSNQIRLNFFNTGKTNNRITKIRSGIIKSSEVDVFYHKQSHIPTSTQLILYTSQKINPTIRHIIDRTLIHFRIPMSQKKTSMESALRH